MKKTKKVYQVIRVKPVDADIYNIHKSKRKAQEAVRLLNGLVEDTYGKGSGVHFFLREQEVAADD